MPTIRILQPTDDRATFRCGDADLDSFFAKYAGQNQFRHHIGTTYVALDDTSGRILGYATVSVASLEIDAVPTTLRKRLPTYPMPVLRLARLAVDQGAQKQGVGSALLRYVLKLAERLANDFGCLGVVVDAKPGATLFYASYGFAELELVEGQSDARPQPTAMFLPLREVRAAMPKR
ncbi:MAG: GNAT family N-acetyltransferase [Polyangiaceae bacterium]